MGRDVKGLDNFVPMPAVVSIHAPAWGATLDCSTTHFTFASFNPRARMGRDKTIIVAAAISLGFNPRARMGRDTVSVLGKRGATKVSIHAPAWGATQAFNIRVHALYRVSIHAPAWGATMRLQSWYFVNMSFQSTRPHGARQKQGERGMKHVIVSIHAPAWGATSTISRISGCVSSFNPRARMGRDEKKRFPIYSYRGFNPRARMGRDSHGKIS